MYALADPLLENVAMIVSTYYLAVRSRKQNTLTEIPERVCRSFYDCMRNTACGKIVLQSLTGDGSASWFQVVLHVALA